MDEIWSKAVIYMNDKHNWWEWEKELDDARDLEIAAWFRERV